MKTSHATGLRTLLALGAAWGAAFRWMLPSFIDFSGLPEPEVSTSLWAGVAMGITFLALLAGGLLVFKQSPLRRPTWFEDAPTLVTLRAKPNLPVRMGVVSWVLLTLPTGLVCRELHLADVTAVTTLLAAAMLAIPAALVFCLVLDQRLRELLTTTSVELPPPTAFTQTTHVSPHLLRTGILVVVPVVITTGSMLLLTAAENQRLLARLAATPSAVFARTNLPGISRSPPATLALTQPIPSFFSSGALVATLFLLLALTVTIYLGRTLAADFGHILQLARHAGTDPRGSKTSIKTPPVFFAEMSWLTEALQSLTARFKGLATAQERALFARKAALRTRNLLFASVSHDLKNPLHAILGFCEVAAQQPLSDPQRDSLNIIEQRGRELLALLEIILDSARMEAGRFSLDRAPCDPHLVIERALQRGNDLGPTHAAPVEVTLPPHLPKVLWDEARVSQALGALLGHAKRLSPGGGVRLHLTELKTPGLRITIFDPSGVFSPQELERLFDANQAATAPKRLGGLALGLSLAKSLIEMHRGTLTIQQEAAGAFRFEINLPLSLRLTP